MAVAILSNGRCRVRPVTVSEHCSACDRAFCLYAPTRKRKSNVVWSVRKMAKNRREKKSRKISAVSIRTRQEPARSSQEANGVNAEHITLLSIPRIGISKN